MRFLFPFFSFTSLLNVFECFLCLFVRFFTNFLSKIFDYSNLKKTKCQKRKLIFCFFIHFSLFLNFFFRKDPTYSVQVFGRKKTATAVAYCKTGRGLINVNGRPLDMIQPQMLKYKLLEPILLLGQDKYVFCFVLNI